MPMSGRPSRHYSPRADLTSRIAAEDNRRRYETEQALEQRQRGEQSGQLDESRACCKRLAGFVREAWHVLEPNTPYVHGWHIDAIAEHLEAVSHGHINRLVINVPPGCMKSLLASVMWQAWEWGPLGQPWLRYLTTSYVEDYAKRDARKTRDLVSSEWYRERWPIELVRAGEMSFENTARGGREAMPFTSLTGGRGNRVVNDDPHSTETVESDAERARASRVLRESITSRLNDPISDAILIIMHRLHARDVCGVIDELGLNYVKLILPMEFEPARRCVTSIGFRDPRELEGELLFPERFPRAVVERDKTQMGSHAVAGQFQQRPVAREGGLFKRHWFAEHFVLAAPKGTRWVRHWDLAASRNASAARTAGIKLGLGPDGTLYVGDAKVTQDEGPAVRRLIMTTAEIDGRDVEISLPQDPGQAGKVQARDLIAMLMGYTVHAEPETGDKVTRAEPYAAQCEAGNVYLVKGPWNEAYLDELCSFPSGAFKDQVDASSGAFARLTETPEPKWAFGAI